ncbi:SemiSWEET family transporter [candidate division KSB1 bacterium]
MNADYIEIWMILMGLIGCYALIPQTNKIITNKSSHDVSGKYWKIALFCQINWLLYGIYIDSLCITVLNVIAISLTSRLIFYIYKYRTADVR